MKTIDQILNEEARHMAQDIDNEIMMTTAGWHKFVLDEGRLHGARYLSVHPDNGSAWNEMMEWMIKTFGASDVDSVWTPDQRWYARNARFWFRDERDLTLFILRWS